MGAVERITRRDAVLSPERLSLKTRMAVVCVLVLLLATVGAGLRLPGLHRLLPFGRLSPFDYAAPTGGFEPLRQSFVDSVLGGQTLGPVGGSRSSIASHSRSLTGAPSGTPTVVSHALTNDHRSQAWTVPSVPFTAHTNTQSATREPGEPADCGQLGNTIWYRYTAPERQALFANTLGTYRATALGVYRSRAQDLERVAPCDDDVKGNTIVPFVADGGVTYFFQVTVQLDGDLTFNLDLQGKTVMASTAADGTPNDRFAGPSSISLDGRYVAFEATATNLVPGTSDKPCQLDTSTDSGHRFSSAGWDGRGPCGQIYVKDLATGGIEMVSVASRPGHEGEPGNSSSSYAMISGDGRYVTFSSYATNLVAGDNNHASDVFVHDRVGHRTERVSVNDAGGEAHSDDPVGSQNSAISADGRFVAFPSYATDLVDDDTNGIVDIFVRDRVRRTTERVSVSSTGSQSQAAPADLVCLRFLCYEPGPPSDIQDPLIPWNRWIEGDALTAWGRKPSLSADGRYVVFASEAIGLVEDDTNHAADVFVRDRLLGTTERVNVSDDGHQANESGGSRYSTGTVISDDGRYVVFDSLATNLAPSATNGRQHIYVHDRVLRRTTLLAVAPYGEELDARSFDPVISGNGRYVGFNMAGRIGGYYGNDRDYAAFIRDLATGVTFQVPVGDIVEAEPWLGGLSADGRRVTLWTDSFEANVDGTLVPYHVYVHEFPRLPGQS